MSELIHFSLFSDCIPVKGSLFGCIYDLTRHELYRMPQEYFLILDKLNSSSISVVRSDYENPAEFDKYLEFLLDHQLGQFILEKNKHLFPGISTQFKRPQIISNGIIDFSNQNIDLVYSSCLDQLINLECKHLLLRFPPEMNSHEIDLIKILKKFDDTIVESIEIVLNFKFYKDKQTYQDLMNKFQRVRMICFYNAPYTKSTFHESLQSRLVFTEINNLSALHCGEISQEFFAINIEAYTESLHHNSCLHQKISIDINGEIKNCPSMIESFGNIQNTELLEALNKEGFKKNWNIIKDKIHVCKDCEYRHICTDCRAYIEDPEDILSKPLKCGYNPYTGKWGEWGTNPLKQKSIDFYGVNT